MKVDLKDIGLFDLDSQTVLLISKFVRVVRREEGIALALTDVALVRKVFDIGMLTRNTELKHLFNNIRVGLEKNNVIGGTGYRQISSIENGSGDDSVAL